MTQRTNHAHLMYAIHKKNLFVLVLTSSIFMIRAEYVYW